MSIYRAVLSQHRVICCELSQFVVLVAGAIAIQIPLTGLLVGSARRRVFDKKFVEKAKSAGLLDEHKKITGADSLPSGGYPDMVRKAVKLSGLLAFCLLNM